MKIEMRDVEVVKPYEANPRVNDGTVDAVAASIREFGLPPTPYARTPRTLALGVLR